MLLVSHQNRRDRTGLVLDMHQHCAVRGCPAGGFLMPYSAPLRDRIAVAICNGVMRVLATEHYRKMITGAIRLGLQTAADESLALVTISLDEPPKAFLDERDLAVIGMYEDDENE